MKISDVRTRVMGTPWRDLTFVIVETDAGLTGVGEVRVLNRTEAFLGYLKEAAPRYLLGRDPFNTERIFEGMFRHDFARAGEIVMSAVAALHLDACTPNFKIQEHFNDFADAWVKQAVSGFPEVVDGYFGLPEGPGLGITLNEAFVAEHPRQSVHFDLFADDWHKRQATSGET